MTPPAPKPSVRVIEELPVPSYNGTPCIIWTGPKSASGYGRVCINGKTHQAHRIAYLLTGRKIPRGLVLDHLCRTRACVNPDHLEPVTNRENILRGNSPNAILWRNSTCKRGHPLVEGNLYNKTDKRSGRTCAQCRREWNRMWRVANPGRNPGKKRNSALDATGGGHG